MQFLFAPAWGRLSDRIGRRPVMLVSNLRRAGSYALFAIASGMNGTTGLIWILISRIFAGICGANLSVASAYIADISPPEKRTARMGLIGMAFGLGFIFGPALGAFTAHEFDGKVPAGLPPVFARRISSSAGSSSAKAGSQIRIRRRAAKSESMVAHARAAQTRTAHRRFLFRDILLHLF